MRTAPPLDQLRTRSLAFALTARSLGRDPSTLHDERHVASLREALAELSQERAIEVIDPIAFADLPPVATLAGRWVRWFDLGRVAPYEGSNVVLSAGGVTPRLADIAGYYRAFNMQVRHDRPDHVVAELEFLAYAIFLEADAVERRDDEHADVIAEAVRSFIRDHIGIWIDAWAARVAAVPELLPWAPFAAAAAELVRAEAALRNVVPARPAPVLAADYGIADDDEPLLECD